MLLRQSMQAASRSCHWKWYSFPTVKKHFLLINAGEQGPSFLIYGEVYQFDRISMCVAFSAVVISRFLITMNASGIINWERLGDMRYSRNMAGAAVGSSSESHETF